MGAVLTGYTGYFPGLSVIGNRVNSRLFPLHEYYRELNRSTALLRHKGFAPIFKDNIGRANQSRHFWLYVQSGYFEGITSATAGNIFHETIDPTANKDEKSWQDFFLGVEGTSLGYQLSTGAISPTDTGNWIRDNLSPNSLSANYWNNPFTATSAMMNQWISIP